jgi:hypothetical protein
MSTTKGRRDYDEVTPMLGVADRRIDGVPIRPGCRARAGRWP